MKDKERIKVATRAFLCANKGKTFTSKQISEFLNEHGFGGMQGCTSANVARLMTYEYCYRYRIQRERKDSKQLWHYGVSG